MEPEMFPQNKIHLAYSLDALVKKTPDKLKVEEIYLDGKLKKAEDVDEKEKSYGIFMHSLVLSNYAEVMRVNNNQVSLVGDEQEKAIFYYTEQKGFDKNLIERIAPKVEELTFGYEDNIKVSTHLINEKMRIVSKGTPEELLKRCSHILLDSKFVKATRKVYKEVNRVLNDMINRCCVVYALAIKDMYKVSQNVNVDAYVNGMTLVALIGMCYE
jgi:magnesium-transporting ATPase (P-type)